MQAKIDAIEANYIWEMVDLPPGKVPITYNTIYKINFKANGEVERHKVQIVRFYLARRP